MEIEAGLKLRNKETKTIKAEVVSIAPAARNSGRMVTLKYTGGNIARAKDVWPESGIQEYWEEDEA